MWDQLKQRYSLPWRILPWLRSSGDCNNHQDTPPSFQRRTQDSAIAPRPSAASTMLEATLSGQRHSRRHECARSSSPATVRRAFLSWQPISHVAGHADPGDFPCPESRPLSNAHRRRLGRPRTVCIPAARTPSPPQPVVGVRRRPVDGHRECAMSRTPSSPLGHDIVRQPSPSAIQDSSRR